MKHTHWKKTLFLAILLTVVVAGVAVFLVRGNADANDEGPVVTVKRGDLHIRVQEVGLVEPFRRVELKSKVAGQALEVLVDVGDRVKAGDMLVRLDPHDTKQALRRAAAEHRVQRVMLAQANKLLGFKRKAHDLGVLSDLELASVQGDVRRLEAQNAVHSAIESQLGDQLEATRLRSPIDGVVLVRNIEPGEMVSPGVAATVKGKPLLVVAQIERLLVRIELNQLDVIRLTVGKKVEVRVDALPGVLLEGKIYRIAAMGQKSERRPDSRLQIFPVDVVVDASKPGAERLKPGMMADIRVQVQTFENVLTIPLDAIVYRDGKPYVRKLDSKREEKLVAVDLGQRDADMAEVITGVSEGDQLRVRPADTEARNES